MKLWKLYNHQEAILITDNPWFYISLTTMIIGTQLFLAGFLGEIILRTKNNEERYKIQESYLIAIILKIKEVCILKRQF